MILADDLLVIVDDHPTARQCVRQSGVAHVDGREWPTL
jgi:hypothetical protein